MSAFIICDIVTYLEIYEKCSNGTSKIVLSYDKISKKRDKSREGQTVLTGDLWRLNEETDSIDEYFDYFL